MRLLSSEHVTNSWCASSSAVDEVFRVDGAQDLAALAPAQSQEQVLVVDLVEGGVVQALAAHAAVLLEDDDGVVRRGVGVHVLEGDVAHVVDAHLLTLEVC